MIGGQHIDGFLKILFDPVSRRILGCAAIGESAVEIIHIGQSVMSLGGTIEYFRTPSSTTQRWLKHTASPL